VLKLVGLEVLGQGFKKPALGHADRDHRVSPEKSWPKASKAG
jgi:hypothetical protein